MLAGVATTILAEGLQGAYRVIGADDLHSICELTQKHANVPMDFADASLVVIAEKLRIRHVVSIDSDFYIFRTLSQGYLENLLFLQEDVK